MTHPPRTEPTKCSHKECSTESGCVTQESDCPHEHDDRCGYTPASGETACPHEHDDRCGYAAAVEGRDCHYECAKCAAPVCTCEAFCDGLNFECTVCAEDFGLCTYYVPTCYCVEKCTEDSVNEFCDICGADDTACMGEDSTAAYSTFTPVTKNSVDNGKAIQIGTNAIDDYLSSANAYDYIYFGTWDGSPIKWRVLDADNTNTGDDGLFLLSDILLGTGSRGGVYFDNVSPKTNEWQNSSAQAWCKDFAGEEDAATKVDDAFTAGELGAVLSTTKSDQLFTSSSNVQFSASENILNGDKVFFLSAEEAENKAYGFTGDDARIAYYTPIDEPIPRLWYLRSPIPFTKYFYWAGSVKTSGSIFTRNVEEESAARPAFNLNLNSVLFASAAEGGKAGTLGSISEIKTTNPQEWTLTLLDSDHQNFSLTGVVKSENRYTVSYSGAAAGANEYLSVMIADNTGAYTHYGRVAQLDGTINGASGTVEIDLSNITIPTGGKLYVFNEQYNGGEEDDTKRTDYASPLKEIAAHTVSFNGNGGYGMMDTVYVSGSYTLPENGFTAPTSHTFKGWATSATGDVISGTTYDVTADTTLYAIWGGDLANAVIGGISNQTYNGSAFTPTVTVTLGNKTLTQGTDYTVSYSSNTNAGTAGVTIVGTGSYTGTQTVYFTIAQAQLSLSNASLVSKTYDGTTEAVVDSVNFSGLKNNETLTLGSDYTAVAVFDDANAGTGKTANITVTLLATDKAKNYILSNSTYTLTGQNISKETIAAISPEFPVLKDLAKEYSFPLTGLLPALTAPAQYGNISYSVVSVTDSENILTTDPATGEITGDSLALNVASVAYADNTAEIVIGITTDNYTVENVTLTVKTVDKFPLLISGITAANRAYNGEAYTYSGSPVFTSTSEDKTVTGISFTAEYEGRDDTTYAKSIIAPTASGKYNLILTVSGDSANTYTGSTTIPFEITKKAITLTADSFTVKQGVALPDPTYKITAGALASGDSFTTAPILTHAAQDTATIGSYDITISGGTIINGSEDRTTNYDITYTKGTLRVVDKTDTVTATNGTGGGSSDASSGTGNTTEQTTAITIPVSGDENTIHVEVSVSGTTATIDHIDASALNNVIGSHVATGVVTIDFSGLNKNIDVVKIPADVVKQIADAANNPNNDAESLEIVFTDGTSIAFDAKALGEKSRQAEGLDITISIKHTSAGNANLRQLLVIGDRPAYDINVTSGGKHISDMGGKISVHAPYELRPGERPEHLVVWYVDDHGNREACETNYDSVRKRVSWKTDHLSIYMIGYDESIAWSIAGEKMASGNVDDTGFHLKTGEDATNAIPPEDSEPVITEGDSMDKEGGETAGTADSSQGAQRMDFESEERGNSWWILLMLIAIAVAVVILSRKKKENE